MFCQGRRPAGGQGHVFLLSVLCGSKGVIAPVDVLFRTEAAQMDPASTRGNAEAPKAAGRSLLPQLGDVARLLFKTSNTIQALEMITRRGDLLFSEKHKSCCNNNNNNKK